MILGNDLSECRAGQIIGGHVDLGEFSLNLGIRQGLFEEILEAFQSVRGRFLRSHDAVDGIEDESFAEKFREGGGIGIIGIAPRAADGDDADVLGMRLEIHHGSEAYGNMFSQQGGYQFRAAVVGHIGQIGAGKALHDVFVEKPLGGQRAGAGKIVLAGFGFGLAHQILHAGNAGIGPHAPTHGKNIDLGHRSQIFVGEAAVFVLGHHSQHVGRGQAQRVAVRTRFDHFQRGGNAAASGFAGDQQGDVMFVLKVFGDDTGRRIRSVARAEGHDQSDGTIRKCG